MYIQTNLHFLPTNSFEQFHFVLNDLEDLNKTPTLKFNKLEAMFMGYFTRYFVKYKNPPNYFREKSRKTMI